MKDIKKIYGCIILLFAIYTLLEKIPCLLFVFTSIFNINIYAVLFCQILLYISMIYFVFFKLKSLPQFRMWFIIVIFILYFIPKNFFYIPTIGSLLDFAKLMDFAIIEKIIGIPIFALFAYVKYYRIKEETENNEKLRSTEAQPQS